MARDGRPVRTGRIYWPFLAVRSGIKGVHVSVSFFFREYRGGQTLGDGGGTCRRRDRLIQIDRREAKPNEALVANLRDGRPGRGITGERAGDENSGGGSSAFMEMAAPVDRVDGVLS